MTGPRPVRSANAAAVTAGRTEALGDVAGNAAMDAIFEAVFRITEARGRDPQPLRVALETWRRGLDGGHREQHRRDFRYLRRVLSRASGRRVGSRVGPAMMGIDAAVLALATHDLVNATGPYTENAREHLLGPWRKATGGPQ